jgi:hypothetical protein
MINCHFPVINAPWSTTIDCRKMAVDYLHAISKSETAFVTQRLMWVPQNVNTLYLPAKEILEYIGNPKGFISG